MTSPLQLVKSEFLFFVSKKNFVGFYVVVYLFSRAPRLIIGASPTIITPELI